MDERQQEYASHLAELWLYCRDCLRAPTHQRQSLLAISASKTRVIDAARSRSPLNQRCAESKMSQLASIAHNPERVVKSDVDATGPRRRAVDVSSQSGVVRMMSIAATGCSKQCRASEKQSPRSGAGNEGSRSYQIRRGRFGRGAAGFLITCGTGGGDADDDGRDEFPSHPSSRASSA